MKRKLIIVSLALLILMGVSQAEVYTNVTTDIKPNTINKCARAQGASLTSFMTLPDGFEYDYKDVVNVTMDIYNEEGDLVIEDLEGRVSHKFLIFKFNRLDLVYLDAGNNTGVVLVETEDDTLEGSDSIKIMERGRC